MKKILLNFGVAGSAIMTFIGSFAFSPKPYLNIIYAIRVSSNSFSYTTVQPVNPSGCKVDATNVACTISSTATVGYFTTNNLHTFPAQSAGTPTTPVVNLLDQGKIYK